MNESDTMEAPTMMETNQSFGNPSVQTPAQGATLREAVQTALKNYFAHIGNQEINHLYEMVLSEIEAPLLETVMSYTRGNQSKAAKLLGISRGTLRKKLKKYGIE